MVRIEVGGVPSWWGSFVASREEKDRWGNGIWRWA
jgi:hypothetical protein